MQLPSSPPEIPEAEDLFPAQFPTDQFPSYGWTQRPSGFPNEAWTTETTHRDGQQGGLPLSTEESLRIYDLLCRFTGKVRRNTSSRVLCLSKAGSGGLSGRSGASRGRRPYRTDHLDPSHSEGCPADPITPGKR